MAVQTLTDRDDGRSLTVRVQDLIEIHLAENASAGFRWEPDRYDVGMLELVEAAARYPDAARDAKPDAPATITLGSGGDAVFRFRVTRSGSGAIALKYHRHWETGVPPARRFSVTVNAAD